MAIYHGYIYTFYSSSYGFISLGKKVLMSLRLVQGYVCILLIVWVGYIFSRKNSIHTPYLHTTVHNAALLSENQHTILDDSLSLGQTGNIYDTVSFENYTYNTLQATTLKQLYAQSPRADILLSLIDMLLAQHKFDEAYEYVQQAYELYPKDLDPYTHIYATLHAPNLSISQQGSIKIVENIVTEYRNKSLITADDYLFYQSLIQFWYNDFASASVLLQQINSPKYNDIKNTMNDVFATIATQKDIPAYYGNAIVSLTLMQHGYYSIAKKIASTIVLQNKQYILPYQILAHSHFLTHNRDTAISYLLILRDIESKQWHRYTFLIGVAHYRRADYTQAIMYLQQVTSPGLMIDVYRYLFLSYIHGGSLDKATANWQKIIGNSAVSPYDFSTYFYEVFYAPFRFGKQAALYTVNPHIAHISIQQCFLLLATENHDICQYGNAGLSLVLGDIVTAKNTIDPIVEKYHTSYIFHLLGDYYHHEKQYDLADQYYKKALSMIQGGEEYDIILAKIGTL